MRGSQQTAQQSQPRPSQPGSAGRGRGGVRPESYNEETPPPPPPPPPPRGGGGGPGAPPPPPAPPPGG
eukprot:COSAG04_NODE_6405_length_1334_cov_1.028340_2_plen_67_part_01